jgi:sec-independent protein translocase protein TatC
MAEADALREPGVPVPVNPEPGSPVAAPGDESVMSLVDHLGELRTRLFRSILAVVVGSAVGFYFATSVRNFLVELLPTGTVQVLGPGDAFMIQLRISIVIGVILAMPVLLYQGWAFIAPGLTPAERRAVRPWLPLALFFFALGVGLALLVLPYATAFLLSFTDDVFMFLAFGLVMEFPILLVGLARAGILSSARLRASRRYVVLGIAIFAAVATPGGDLVSPLALGATMYLLFEATAFFIRRMGR